MDQIVKALRAQKTAIESVIDANLGTLSQDPAGLHRGRRDSNADLMEKEFLQSVDRGEIQVTKNYLQTAMTSGDRTFNVNCLDPLGRLVFSTIVCTLSTIVL
jgi:hypothetical protein